MTVYLYERLAAAHIADLMGEAASERLARTRRRENPPRADLLRRVAGRLAAVLARPVESAPMPQQCQPQAGAHHV